MGLDHPILQTAIQRWQNTPPEELGASIKGDDSASAIVTWWLVEVLGTQGSQHYLLKPLAINQDGKRQPILERRGTDSFMQSPHIPKLSIRERQKLLHDHIKPMLNRELQQQGLPDSQGSFSTQLVGWLEISGQSQAQMNGIEEEAEEQSFGRVILKARKVKGMNQRELAETVSLNFTYLSKLENDKAEYPPKEDVIRAIARTLDLDEQQLIYLAGRLPQSEEEFIKRNYDRIPLLFKRMQDNPEFADEVFRKAEQSEES